VKNLLQKIKTQLEGYDFFDTLKHSSTYFTAIILINALGIISLPIYTSFLDESDYGIVEVFNTSIKLLAVLMTFNAHQAIGRYYYEEKPDWRSFLGTSFTITFIIFIFISALIFIFKEPILHFCNIPENLFYWLFPATISLIVLSIFNQFFVARKESILVSKGQVFFSYARFLGAVSILFWIMPNYLGRVMGDTSMALLIAGYLFYKIYPHIKWTVQKEHLKYIFKFSIPLIPFSISGFLLNYFDLFMINSTSNSDAGLYAFAYKIGLLFMGLDQALQNAGKPDFFKWMNTRNYAAIRGQVKSIMKFEVLGSVFLILFAFDMGHLLAGKEIFKTSLHLVPIIVMSYVFYGAYNFYSRLLIFSKKTIYISLITIVAGMLNIVLNSIYIPQFGYEAAAFTTLASYTAMLIMGWFVIKIIMKIPAPPLTDILLKISYVGIFLLIGHYLHQLDISYYLVFMMKIMLFIILFVFLFWNKITGFIKS
jgi:Membrane protein involved in the export of O-antigen and teichoic acid